MYQILSDAFSARIFTFKSEFLGYDMESREVSVLLDLQPFIIQSLSKKAKAGKEEDTIRKSRFL